MSGAGLIHVGVAIATLASALVAGIFYAFSTFVMGALAKLPSDQGMRAMQSINVVVINPLFLSVFMGQAVLSLGLAIAGVWMGDSLLILGAALYLLGCLGVTIGGNIPLNETLAKADPLKSEGQELWQIYLGVWSRWNHLRTAMSFGSAGVFLWALLH